MKDDASSFIYDENFEQSLQPVLTRLIVQEPSHGKEQKSMNDNACWLKEIEYGDGAGETQQPDNKNQFPQTKKLNPDNTMYIGILLALLCGIISKQIQCGVVSFNRLDCFSLCSKRLFLSFFSIYGLCHSISSGRISIACYL